jgi:hypothetical protein
LVEVAKASIRQAGRVGSMLEVEVPRSRKISERLSHFAGLLGQVIEQTTRRVLEEEQVPAAQKLVSVFEPHTAIRYAGARHASKPSLVGRCGSLRWTEAS